MTPQEHQLVDDLFDRLAKLEGAPRDPDAERLIADGARRAPHALYALVQTALLQDEALKRANARIEDLQAQLAAGGGAPQREQPQGSFLDSMREAVFGRSEPRASVPSVQPQGGPQAASGGPQSYQPQPGYAPARPAPGLPPQGPYAAGPAFGTGGSFLGTAASAAAGVIGGSLLLDGIRSMFGHHAGFGGAGFGGSERNALGDFGDRGSTPWGGGSSNDDLARQAGLNDVGQNDSKDFGQDSKDVDQNDTYAGQNDTDDNSSDDVAGLADASDDNFDDANIDDGSGDFADSGSDTYDV